MTIFAAKENETPDRYVHNNIRVWPKQCPCTAQTCPIAGSTGLFQKREEESAKPTVEEVEEHRKLREAMLEHSRKSMASIIARYLWNTIREILSRLTSYFPMERRDVVRRLGTIKAPYFNEIVDKIVESIF